MILVFIGFNFDIKIDAGANTSKANSPAIFHGLITQKAFNKSTSFLRNVTT
jgi:hypothetical protein